ncbi:MAG: ankyrin repeat domain-containing protein [Puniceicoccales bacterium]|nr:ankyrin repeat domain-containing protein [Puniceicoccales bacterium]
MSINNVNSPGRGQVLTDISISKGVEGDAPSPQINQDNRGKSPDAIGDTSRISSNTQFSDRQGESVNAMPKRRAPQRRRPNLDKSNLARELVDLIKNMNDRGGFVKNSETIKKLIEDGAITDSERSSIWKDAITSGSRELVELLFEKNGNAILENDDTPLSLAMREGKDEIVKFILGQDKAVVRKFLGIKNQMGDTPLSWAMKNEKDEMVKLILGQDRETLCECLKIQDAYGNTPLHIAMRKGNVDLIKEMVDRGGDINIQNINGNALLDLAVWNKDKDLVEFLLNNGAKWNLKNGSGDTPLCLCVRSGDEELKNLFKKYVTTDDFDEAQKIEQKRLERVKNLMENTRKDTESFKVWIGDILEKFPEEFVKRHRESILAYGLQMINGGDNLIFTKAVCENMIVLYKNKIDDKLPTQVSGDAEAIDAQSKAIGEAVMELKKIMEEGGSDYDVIDHYLNQQVASSMNLES